MHFVVLARGARVPAHATSTAFLHTDDWDDWFQFRTQFGLTVVDAAGTQHWIGEVKIGQFNMAPNQSRPALDASFPALDERFFSLGQDSSYYERLKEVGEAIRDDILQRLRDVAYYPELFERARLEEVTGVSLLRYVSPSTVLGQFYRLARGLARLSDYNFSYTAPRPQQAGVEPATMSFAVEVSSLPPTNIHVLIGRNGVGKTTLLQNMTRALVDEGADTAAFGQFESDVGNGRDGRLFANLVSVTFSAFDPFDPLPPRKNASEGVQYSYVGLKRMPTKIEPRPAPKDYSVLAKEFGESVLVCRDGARLGRWRYALEMLEADPIFKAAEVAELADPQVKDVITQARKLFNLLSSGHKIVLLTITRLVETVEERSLVLLDEPEAHLHPPLLSAFVRALSELLINRNGVAIIATHSPVVLQEVPKRCAWKIWRSGARVTVERPEEETFGENVGILTREVFGLEVTDSGFHKMLNDAVKNSESYEEVLGRFNGDLGGEARAIVRALMANKRARGQQ